MCPGPSNDVQIASLIAGSQLAVESQFHAERLTAHRRLGLIARDKITLRREGKGEIVGDHAILDMRQDGGQIWGFRYRAMVIGKVLNRAPPAD